MYTPHTCKCVICMYLSARAHTYTNPNIVIAQDLLPKLYRGYKLHMALSHCDPPKI